MFTQSTTLERRTFLAGCLTASLLAAEADVPSLLRDTKGKRPRLFVQAAGVKELRENGQRDLWVSLLAHADTLAGRRPPEYQADQGEQLWQRGVGDTIAALAFTALLTGKDRYWEAAGRWGEASCGYPTWGVNAKTGRPAEYGLAYGHQLLGLAMLYDYGGEAKLAKPLRAAIRDTLIHRGATQYGAYRETPHAFLQNHTWINSAGLLAAGLAIWDEHPAALDWIAMVRGILAKTMAVLPEDGASQEGVGYWEYGLEYLLKLMHLSRQLLGDNYFGHPWFQQTAQYGLHLSTPRASWRTAGSLVDLADCPRTHWYGPDYQLRKLAAEYRDGRAQWLAETIEQAGTANPTANWLNLLWNDAAVPVASPAQLPSAHHFPSLGIVSARSDWSGNESLLVFKCGPAIPVNRFAEHPELVSAGDFGHTHPDANHFCFFAHGGWLIRNLGYIQRQTRFHNTLLVNGIGQYDAKNYFDGFAQFQAQRHPRILRADVQSEWCHITGDATQAYPPAAGLTRFVRHVLYLKPDVVIVMDEVETAAAAKLELHFHTERPCVAAADGSWRMDGPGPAFRAELLSSGTGAATLEAATLVIQARHPETQKNGASSMLRLSGEGGTSLITVVAFSAAAAGAAPPRVTWRSEGSRHWFTGAGARTYEFDFAQKEAR